MLVELVRLNIEEEGLRSADGFLPMQCVGAHTGPGNLSHKPGGFKPLNHNILGSKPRHVYTRESSAVYLHYLLAVVPFL